MGEATAAAGAGAGTHVSACVEWSPCCVALRCVDSILNPGIKEKWDKTRTKRRKKLLAVGRRRRKKWKSSGVRRCSAADAKCSPFSHPPAVPPPARALSGAAKMSVLEPSLSLPSESSQTGGVVFD